MTANPIVLLAAHFLHFFKLERKVSPFADVLEMSIKQRQEKNAKMTS